MALVLHQIPALVQQDGKVQLARIVSESIYLSILIDILALSCLFYTMYKQWHVYSTQ